MSDFDTLVHEAARYLEGSKKCSKHHVEHTGSLCYLLDFYTYLGEHDRAVSHIEHLLTLITDTKGGKVFYPGHLNPMNMSQNVIDTGATVDAIARYLHLHRDLFSQEEHNRYDAILSAVAESYLKSAAQEKYLTNQRLWGLTGLASYARYAKTHAYDAIIVRSIETAFSDMTVDGFFVYIPHAKGHGNFEGYDGITAFYQSRCTAFIRYSLGAVGLDTDPYEERLRQSERALLSMYTAHGTKDMRMECKRWYWQSSYEVASAGFDAYALTHTQETAGRVALHNLLFQVHRHFFEGRLHAHIGAQVNFQCPIFWTAHLAWMLRIEDIRERFGSAKALEAFAYRFEGREVFTNTSSAGRVLLNTRWQQRNFNEGTYDNGLTGRVFWSLRVPSLPPAFVFSIRETVNHTWYAIRGGCVAEAALRVLRFARECIVMCLPRYSVHYGKVASWSVRDGVVEVSVTPATKYGTLSEKVEVLTMTL